LLGQQLNAGHEGIVYPNESRPANANKGALDQLDGKFVANHQNLRKMVKK